MAEERIWVEKPDGGKKKILAVNWHFWKRRGAKKCKAPQARYVGGGIYELPDGTRVRGKEAAGLE